MLRILLDENIPAALRRLITATKSPSPTIWAGRCLERRPDHRSRIQGFEVLITADQNIRINRIDGPSVGLIVLSTNIWPTIAPIRHRFGRDQENSARRLCAGSTDRPPRRGEFRQPRLTGRAYDHTHHVTSQLIMTKLPISAQGLHRC
jgi:hypothetical protein